MQKKIWGSVVFALGLMSCASPQPRPVAVAPVFVSPMMIGDGEGDGHALKIAQASRRIQKNFRALKMEANRIQNKKWRELALVILETPVFSVGEGRKNSAPEIIHQLIDHQLISPSARADAFFPMHAPQPFLSAPGSFWSLHHAYPGGLVDHTLTNLKLALSIEKSWRADYPLQKLDDDLIRLAVIWHDSAKAWVDHWQSDGSANKSEGDPIANTGAHHIWGIAEAIYRGLPPQFSVILASAHSPPSGSDKIKVIHYLQAAAIIAGKPYADAGLTTDGTDLADPAPLESFLHHLSDHDYVATEVSLAFVRLQIEANRKAKNQKIDFWREDQILAEYGDLALYQQYLSGGKVALEKILNQMVDN
jgi:hypothetical protein